MASNIVWVHLHSFAAFLSVRQHFRLAYGKFGFTSTLPLSPLPVSYQNICSETAADDSLLLSSSYNLILIQKIWKSCCFIYHCLFLLKDFVVFACPLFSSLRLLHITSLSLQCWQGVQCFQGKHVLYLCRILTTSTSPSVRYSVLYLSILCLCAWLCSTHPFQSSVFFLYVSKRQSACLSWVPRWGLDIVIFYQQSFRC